MIRRFTFLQRLLLNLGAVALAPAFLAVFAAMVRVGHGRPLPLFLFYLFGGSVAVASVPFSAAYLLQQRPQERIRPPAEGLTLNVGVRRGRLLLSMLGWFFPLWIAAYVLVRSVVADGSGAISGLIAFAAVFLAGRRLLFAEHLLRINSEGLHHYRFGLIRWTDVGGLRLDSQLPGMQDRYWLAILLPNPEQLSSQLPGRWHVWLHFWLRRRLTLRISLAYSAVSAAIIYESAASRRLRLAPPPLLGCSGGAAAQSVEAFADAIARDGGESSAERASRLRRAAWPQWTAADPTEKLIEKLRSAREADTEADSLVRQLRSLTDEFSLMTARSNRRRQQWVWVAVLAVFAFAVNLLLRFAFG